jgi:hypothetical protein
MSRGSLIGIGVALALAGATLLWWLQRRAAEVPGVVFDHPAPVLSPAATGGAGTDAARVAGSSTDSAPTIAAEPREVAMRLEHELSRQIEQALVSRDAGTRESAFAFALPELLRRSPMAASALFARQTPGESREALRDEMARHWIRADRDAAVEWLRSVPEADRIAGGMTAVRSLAASSPADAVRVADELGIGRDDGSLNHIVQIWAESDPDAARRWQQ